MSGYHANPRWSLQWSMKDGSGDMERMRTEQLAGMLQEIEACLAEHPQVQRMVVLEQGDRLVAYVVATVGGSVDGEQLRAYMKGRLPAYKIPRYFVLLDSMPLTAGGQVDRSALVDPQAASPGAVAVGTAPHSERVQYLVELWTELLHRKVEAGDNFFDLGGHSMLAVQMANRVHRDTGVRIQLMTLATQSLAQVASTLPAAVNAPSAGLRTRLFGKFKGMLQG